MISLEATISNQVQAVRFEQHLWGMMGKDPLFGQPGTAILVTRQSAVVAEMRREDRVLAASVHHHASFMPAVASVNSTSDEIHLIVKAPASVKESMIADLEKYGRQAVLFFGARFFSADVIDENESTVLLGETIVFPPTGEVAIFPGYSIVQ